MADIKKAIAVLEVNKLMSASQTEFVEVADIAIKALEMQEKLKEYIEECKLCGRGSAVDWLEKYLIN